MTDKRSIIFILLLGSLLYLVLAANTPGQASILQQLLAAANNDSDGPPAEAAYIIFAGQVVDNTQKWLDDYPAILFLNGQEIGRSYSQVGEFGPSQMGVQHGIFHIRVHNRYKLEANSALRLADGRPLILYTQEGINGPGASLFHWFGRLQPGTLIRIEVPHKQIEYALKIMSVPQSDLPPDLLYGKTRLTDAGQVVGPNGETAVARSTAASNNPAPQNAPSTSGYVSWTRQLSGFHGHRWDAWEWYVQRQVPGITWEQFKEEVLVYNPQLRADGNVFYAHKQYMLPEWKESR